MNKGGPSCGPTTCLEGTFGIQCSLYWAAVKDEGPGGLPTGIPKFLSFNYFHLQITVNIESSLQKTNLLHYKFNLKLNSLKMFSSECCRATCCRQNLGQKPTVICLKG